MSFYLLKKERYLDFGLCVLFGMLLMFIIQSMIKKKGKGRRVVKTHLSSVRSYLSKLSDSIRNKFKKSKSRSKSKSKRRHRNNPIKSCNSNPRIISISKSYTNSLSGEDNIKDDEIDDYYKSYISKLSESIKDKIKSKSKAKAKRKHRNKHINKHVKAHNSDIKVLSISKNNAMSLSEEVNRENELDDYYRLYTPTISSNRY